MIHSIDGRIECLKDRAGCVIQHYTSGSERFSVGFCWKEEGEAKALESEGYTVRDIGSVYVVHRVR